jgi:predicted dehydrogenase
MTDQWGNIVAQYRVGIVGLSGITSALPDPALHPSLGSRMPHSHAASYATMPGVEVVAVCDLKPELQRRFVDTWGRTWPNVRTYTRFDEMLERERLDVLSVATSDHLHAPFVIAACEAGVKGIFCEKPLATSVADARRMIAAVERHGVTMSINHWTRWWPPLLQAREAVRAGRIGRLRRVVQSAGGARAMMFRNGTYEVDYLCFFAKSDPVEVFAQLDDEFADYGPRYAGDGGHDPKTDPGYSAYVRFANGIRGLLNYSQGTVDHDETFLVGETGWVRFGTDTPLEIASREAAGQPLTRVVPPLQQYVHTGTLANLADFFQALEHGGETLSPPREALKAVEIMIGALQSHHRGGVRVRLPLEDEGLNHGGGT